MKSLAIFARRHAGKTTLANMFVELGWERLALADPLKDMLLTLPGITPDHLWGDRKEEEIPLYGCTARHLMQTLGTEWRAHIRPDLWTRVWEAKACAESSVNQRRPGGWVCDDGRFPHELEFFRSRGVLTIGLFRPETDATNDAVSAHESEAFPFTRSDFGAVIENSGTLDQLRTQARVIADRLLA